MSARTPLLLSAMLAAAVLFGPAHAADSGSSRVSAFAALPDWTGLWEAESSAGLLATGRFEVPKLWGKPPYNAEWEQKSRGAPLTRLLDLPPTAKVCEPVGFPQVMEVPVPDYVFEMLVTPEQTLLVSTDGSIRHIYTDGRQHPKREDLWPTPDGHSIGRWDGDTLVIDTIARAAGRVGPQPNAADLSEEARFTERLRMLDSQTLQNEMTIDDPQRLAHPWKLVIHYKRAKHVDRMIAVNCRENDRNPLVEGGFVISPP